MGGIGPGILQLGPPLVVEVQHEAPVAVPALDGCDIVDIILFPQAAGVPEGGEPALGAHTGAGQYDDSLFHSFTSK